MSATEGRAWTWEHSLILAFMAFLVNGCVALTLAGVESLGERVSAELDSAKPRVERDPKRAPVHPPRAPRPHVSSLNPLPEGETMRKTEEEPMSTSERRAAREAERVGEIDSWIEEDTLPEITPELLAGNVAGKKEAGK